MRSIIWTRPAQRDLNKIDDHYADFAPDYADRVSRMAVKSARQLIKFPHLGPIIGEDDVRKWGVKRTDFLLFYRVTNSAIEILRIRHAREDWMPPL
jgi:toxin ParE1/3/4